MKLLIFRHGPAEPRSSDRPDADRALTREGTEKTRLAAQGLARIVDRPGIILTSPKRRARQTAGILGDVFDLPIETADALAGDEVRPMEKMLRARPEDALAIVGHEPTLSRLAGQFLGVSPRDGELTLKKAGAIVLHVACRPSDPPGPNRLELMLPGRVLRALANPAAPSAAG
ncbi:MAG: phosphohistidine phosphatase SixA [Phycisphaeraceae bacterium]